MWLSLSSMTESRSCAMSRLVPLGSHRRSSALVCSLVGRCHGERGSQKNTSMPSAASMSARRAFSRPWSQVRVRTSPPGWRPSAAAASPRSRRAGRCARRSRSTPGRSSARTRSCPPRAGPPRSRAGTTSASSAHRPQRPAPDHPPAWRRERVAPSRMPTRAPSGRHSPPAPSDDSMNTRSSKLSLAAILDTSIGRLHV